MKHRSHLTSTNFDFFRVLFRKHRDGPGASDDVRDTLVPTFVALDRIDTRFSPHRIDVCSIRDDTFVIFAEKRGVFIYSGFKQRNSRDRVAIG